MARRIAVIATHPIQYHAPWFRHLALDPRLEIEVGFLEQPSAERQGVGFGVAFEWDLPLTDGYSWRKLDSVLSERHQGFGFFGRRLRSARRQLASMRPDAVLVLGWNQLGLVQAWAAARTLGIPVIIRGESNAKRPRASWKRAIHSLLLSQAHAYVTIGKSNFTFYRDAGVPPDHLFRGAYFVDNEYFSRRADSLNRSEARERFGVPFGSCCVLFAGKFESKKRPLDLFTAVSRMPEVERQAVHLLMVGSGELDPILKHEATAMGLSVSWAGFLNQSVIPAAYRAADVLVLPSDHGETWGLVVNEAMACGVPCIVGDQVGCADDLVVNGETGWVYPTGDVGALCEAITQAAGDEGRRLRYGAAARAKVHSEYTIQRSADALVAAVDFVLDRPDSRSARS